jgi:acyl-CoA synthetase (AMP-forming)/AMP-acid ligase II
MLCAQAEQVRSFLDIKGDEMDLATYPMFALFDIVLGSTAVLPDMDPTKPAKVNPAGIAKTINDHRITNIFGSPALLDRVGRYGQPRGIKFPSVKRVLSGGAPVSSAIMERFSALLDEAEVYSIYGATECLPISYIGSREVIGEISRPEHLTHGICVGRPLPDIELRIIKISDEPISEFSDNILADKEEIGEITIRCEHMSTKYFQRPDADADHKIIDGKHVWHRMGDLGFIDYDGRVWFCGRKKQRVVTRAGTLFTIPCENVFNSHPLVKRSALVGIIRDGHQLPVICIEPEKNVAPDDSFKNELLELARKHRITSSIENIISVQNDF